MKVRLDGPNINDIVIPLPSLYYELVRRVVRVSDLRDQLDRSDPLWLTAQTKLDALLTELQTVLDATLGSARCPICHGITITAEMLRTKQAVRVCAKHDLTVIRLREGMRAPPGTGNIA